MEFLCTAAQAEISAFIAEHEHLVDEGGRRRLVRRNSLPEREAAARTGKIAVPVPRLRNRRADQDGRIRFRSSIVPPWLRKAQPVEELAPRLCPKGISTGDFGDALAALLGPDAEGLSASGRHPSQGLPGGGLRFLAQEGLSSRRVVNACADGFHFTLRLEGDR